MFKVKVGPLSWEKPQAPLDTLEDLVHEETIPPVTAGDLNVERKAWRENIIGKIQLWL